MSVHFLAYPLKLGAERRIGNIMNIPLKTVLRVICGHTGALRSQVGMIIHAEKNILHAVLTGCDPKEAAH